MYFKFLNIPVCIHPSFWVFLIFFTNIYQDLSMESLICGVVLIMSLLVHEYGHALTALYFGARPEINLEAFGGNARYNSFGITPKQQFIITLNGPLLESVLIAFSYYLLKSGTFDHHYYIQYFLYVTMRLNIIWCLLNLIPIVPLDGGHLLKYLLERRFGERGAKISTVIGLISAVVVVPYLFYNHFFFFGVLVLIFSLQHLSLFQKFKISSGEHNSFSSYIKGVEAIKNNDLENAKIILKKLLKCKENNIKNSATESLAKIYYQENEHRKAYDLLLKADHGALKEGKCLLCKLAFEQKNYEIIEKYSRDIYEIEPSYEIAVLNSKAFAQLNQMELSHAWMETASQFSTHPE